MTSFPSLEDLIWLFEAEPDVQFADEGWPASAATWTSIRGEFELVCTIAPHEGSVQITCAASGNPVVDLQLLYVVDHLTIDRVHGTEALTLTFQPAARLKPLRLQLKPFVSISVESARP